MYISKLLCFTRHVLSCFPIIDTVRIMKLFFCFTLILAFLTDIYGADEQYVCTKKADLPSTDECRVSGERFETVKAELREIKALLDGKDRQCPQVTKYAFSSRLKHSKNIATSNEVVVFDQVDYNGGDMYDARTGKVTIPEDGVYVFFYTCMAKPRHLSQLGLVVDGKRVDRCWGDSQDSGSAFQIDSRMQTMYLTRGKIVYVDQVDRAHAYIHAFHTTFGGFKL